MAAAAARHTTSLCLSKQGDARFLGHLDFARVVERSLRRSGLPVRYTEGFNPRIKLAFHDALPVGVASEGEWVTLILEEDLALDDVQARLAPTLPGVVTLEQVRRGDPPALDGSVRYHLEVLSGVGSATDALHELLEREACLVEDPRRGKTLDVRPHLVSGEATAGGLMVELIAVDGRPPRPGPLVQALRDLAGDAGNDPPRFGTATRLRPHTRRRGDDRWADDVGTTIKEQRAAAVAEAGGASSSSTPRNPKRAASPS